MTEETFVRTERLAIRRFRGEDAPLLAAYRGDPEVARYQGWSPPSEAEARAFVEEMRAGEPGVRGQWFQFALGLLPDEGLIGDVGLKLRGEEPATADIGYTLAAAHQGRGLASEAVRAVIAMCFERFGVERVVATIDARNAASLALARRLEMTEVEVVETIWRGEPCVERVFVVRRP